MGCGALMGVITAGDWRKEGERGGRRERGSLDTYFKPIHKKGIIALEKLVFNRLVTTSSSLTSSFSTSKQLFCQVCGSLAAGSVHSHPAPVEAVTSASNMRKVVSQWSAFKSRLWLIIRRCSSGLKSPTFTYFRFRLQTNEARGYYHYEYMCACPSIQVKAHHLLSTQS